MERLNKFIDILSNSNPHTTPLDFLSYRYINTPLDPLPIDTKTVQPPQFIPTINEAIVHLKLLKAFQVMKNKVLIDYETDEEEYCEKRWQSFITLAVRRFIIFVSAIRVNAPGGQLGPGTESQIFNNANIKQDSFVKFMNDLMPPLDVIMVWHSFLLNPKTFYDTCLRTNVLRFANFPLPLYKLNQFIDNYTFEFNVNPTPQENYLNLIKSFTNDERDYQYDIATKFSLYKQTVRFYCPGCTKVLTDWVRISDENQMGLADRNLSVRKLRSRSFVVEELPPSKCPCINISMITHESLRILHLIIDARRKYPLLPGTFKYFSLVICNPKYSARSPTTLSEDICLAVQKSYLATKDLTTIINDIPKEYANETTRRRVILRNYLQFNYISATVENGIEVGEDLVGCVLRQERFLEKINKMDWLHSPLIHESLLESLIRYKRFFLMLTADRYRLNILVPTLDIDLLWHTYQLSMYGYFRDCRTSPCHYVIDHDDKIDENRLDDAFARTARRYRHLFKDNYSICYCQYCTNYRTKYANNGLLTLFQTKKKLEIKENAIRNNPLFDGEKQGGVTHISIHNSIQMPTKKATKRRQKNPVPWENNRIDGGHYVVVPDAPITTDHCQFYGTGLCNSVNAQCVSDSGKCCSFASCTSFGGSACVTDSGLACGGDGGDGGGCGGD